jgi:hypothetical protein
MATHLLSLSLLRALFLEQLLNAGGKRKIRVCLTASMMVRLGGMVQQGLSDGRARMDSRRVRALYGGVVVSATVYEVFTRLDKHSCFT